MAFSIKKFLQSTSIYGFLGFLPAASKFLLFPLFVKILSPSDYGLLSLNAAMVAVLIILIGMGLNTGVGRFYFDYRRTTRLINAYFSTILLSIKIIGAVVFLVIFSYGDEIFGLIFSDPANTFMPYGIYALIIAYFISINGVILAFHRSAEKPLAFGILAGGTFVFMTAFEAYAILVQKSGADGVLYARTAGLMLFSVMYWIWMYNKIGVRFDKRFLRNSLNYGLPLVPYSILAFVYFSADRFLIENILPDPLFQLGIFNTAFTIAFVVETVIIAIQNSSTPTIYGYMKEDYHENFDKVNKIFRLTGAIILLLVCFILIATPPFILIYTVEDYYPALYLVPLLLGGFLFKYLFTVYSTPIFYSKKTKHMVWLNVVAAIFIIGGNLLLLPSFGLIGAAITMFVARLMQLLATIYLAKKETEFKFNLGYIYPAIGILFIFLVAVSFVTEGGVGKMLLLYSIPSILVVLALLFWFLVKAKEIKKKGIKHLLSYV